MLVPTAKPRTLLLSIVLGQGWTGWWDRLISDSHRQADVMHCSRTVKLINDQSIIGLTHRKNHSNQNPAASCDFFPPARREGAGVGCGVSPDHSHMQSMEYVLLLIQVTTHFIWVLLGPQ